MLLNLSKKYNCFGSLEGQQEDELINKQNEKWEDERKNRHNG